MNDRPVSTWISGGVLLLYGVLALLIGFFAGDAVDRVAITAGAALLGCAVGVLRWRWLFAPLAGLVALVLLNRYAAEALAPSERSTASVVMVIGGLLVAVLAVAQVGRSAPGGC